MDQRAKARYLEILGALNVSEVSRATGRARTTLVAYQTGRRNVSPAAVRELVQYLRDRAEMFITAADDLEAGLGRDHG